MYNSLYEILDELLGLQRAPADLTFTQISLRGLMVFVAALAIIRCGDKRFMSKMTALDAILGFILASTLSRAINGSAPFFPTLGASLVIVLFHRVLAALSYHSHWIGQWIKGNSDVLIENGKVNRRLMARNHISDNDLVEELRLNGNIDSFDRVKAAVLERSGQISIVKLEG